MRITKKDILADVCLFVILGILGFGVYLLLKPSLNKLSLALHLPIPSSEALPVGTVADDQWVIETLESKKIPMSAFKGKVVFLNFWATWCGPCIGEIKSIENLYAQFKNQDVVFLLVSHEERETLVAFAQGGRHAAPIYRVEKIPDSLNVKALPTTIILSRSGQVALSHIGAKTWDRKKYVALINGLLTAPNAEAIPKRR